jgi:hypothetical protein
MSCIFNNTNEILCSDIILITIKNLLTYESTKKININFYDNH